MSATPMAFRTAIIPTDGPPPDTIVAENRLIEWRTPQRVERILAIDWTIRYVYTILVDGENADGKGKKSALPKPQPLATVERALQNGEAHLFPLGAPDPYAPAPLVPPIEPTGGSPRTTWKRYRREKTKYDRRAAERDKVWAIIEAAVTEKRWDLLDKTPRGNVVTAIMARTGVSKPTVYAHLRRYWQGGQTREAAQLPRNHREKGEVRDVTAKMGAPNAHVGPKKVLCKQAKAASHPDEGVNMTPTFREAFVRGVNTYYLGQGMTYEKAYAETLKSETVFWCEIALPDGTVSRTKLEPGRVPTLRQFK